MDTSLFFDDLIAKETASDVDGITSVALLAVARSGMHQLSTTSQTCSSKFPQGNS